MTNISGFQTIYSAFLSRRKHLIDFKVSKLRDCILTESGTCQIIFQNSYCNTNEIK